MADSPWIIHRVIHETGNKTHYCDPEAFFKTTYATTEPPAVLRGRAAAISRATGGEPIINVAQTFGGGKSHTLTTLLLHDDTRARSCPEAGDVGAAAFWRKPSWILHRRPWVAAVSFDKVDWKKWAASAKAPDGTVRSFPDAVEPDCVATAGAARAGHHRSRWRQQPDYDTPPADTLWSKLLAEVEKSGKGALILVDEFLMWAHDAASPDPTGTSKNRGAFWNDRLKNFFQRLSQAVEASQGQCLVVSLLATDPAMRITVGKESGRVQSRVESQATVQSPVEKGDLAELSAGGCSKSFRRIRRTGIRISWRSGTG